MLNNVFNIFLFLPHLRPLGVEPVLNYSHFLQFPLLHTGKLPFWLPSSESKSRSHAMVLEAVLYDVLVFSGFMALFYPLQLVPEIMFEPPSARSAYLFLYME